jgi:hypothetical protein
MRARLSIRSSASMRATFRYRVKWRLICRTSAAKVSATLADLKSMQNSSLHYFFSCYLTHFDVVVWKLIFKQQAFSQCIRIASMYRIRSTIDLEDIVLVRESAVRRDPIFHETPHHSPETLFARRATRRWRAYVNFALNGLQSPKPCGIQVLCCINGTRLMNPLSFSRSDALCPICCLHAIDQCDRCSNSGQCKTVSCFIFSVEFLVFATPTLMWCCGN